MTWPRVKVEAIALGWTLAMVGCSEEYIELRPSTGDAADPTSSFSSDDALVAEQEPHAEAAAAYETGETPPDSDNVQLPSSFTALTQPEAPQGCRKIDLLFVIDSSRSMDEEQANLTRSVPGLVTAMNQVLGDIDMHVMVVATDGDEEEEDEPTLDPEDCDEVRGAGKRRSADGDDCGIQGGLAFMTNQQPELATTFSCAANVGTRGSAFEEPVDAMLQATGSLLNAPGRCNAGFLREDAMLVVTLITDEEDTRSKGDPEDWRRSLLDAKSGTEGAVVVLGLVGDAVRDGQCGLFDAERSPRLQTFVTSFEGHGVLGSVCAPDYAPFFDLMLGSIDAACKEFVPPMTF